jgi:hypothetical protein
MADEHRPEDAHPATDPHLDADPAEKPPAPPTEVVARPLPLPERAGDWRSRALAVRAALPQLARHPVVVGATAAAATVAVRVALDVAQRAITGSAAGSTRSVEVSGRILHEVHVVRHVHVVRDVVHHHVVHNVVERLPPGTLWSPGPPNR